jgi:hypothetical protein
MEQHWKNQLYQGGKCILPHFPSLKGVISSQFSDSSFFPIRKTYGGPEVLSFSISHIIPLSFLKKEIVLEGMKN